MKISMHLRKTLGLPSQAPAPPVAGFFDSAQEIRRDELVAIRVTIGQPHDAFAMADQLPEPALIEGGVALLSGMDLRQVTCQGYRSFSILLLEPSAFGHSFEVKMIAGSLHPLGEDKKLPCRRDRHEFLVRRKGADVKRLHVARQPAIGVIIPEDRLGPVRGMLVPERAWFHGFKYGRLHAATDLECQLNRYAIAISFPRPLRTGLADHLVGH